MMNNYYFSRNSKQIEDILTNENVTDETKLKQLLKNDSVKQVMGVQSQIHAKLVDFLQKRDVIEKLLMMSLAVPHDPNNVDESYK